MGRVVTRCHTSNYIESGGGRRIETIPAGWQIRWLEWKRRFPPKIVFRKVLPKTAIALALFGIMGCKPTFLEPLAGSEFQARAAEANFDREEMLAAHNEWRSRVGVPPLEWSAELESYARNWAEELADRGFDMEHRPDSPYGENLYWSAGRRASPEDVVESWGSEVENYNYDTNTCNGVCGHYTQIVWEDTREVGCAVVRGSHPDYGTQEIWVCNYDPPGNYVGERPY